VLASTVTDNWHFERKKKLSLEKYNHWDVSHQVNHQETSSEASYVQ
jgi:hypothetical protein